MSISHVVASGDVTDDPRFYDTFIEDTHRDISHLLALVPRHSQPAIIGRSTQFTPVQFHGSLTQFMTTYIGP